MLEKLANFWPGGNCERSALAPPGRNFAPKMPACDDHRSSEQKPANGAACVTDGARSAVQGAGRISIPLISGFSSWAMKETSSLPSATSTLTISM